MTKGVKNVLFIAIVLSALSLTESTLTKGCRILEFKQNKETNKILSKHVIKSVTVGSEALCMHSCFMSPRCVSINTGPSSSYAKTLCQLNSADRVQYPKDFKEKPGFSYRGVEENQCSSDTCAKQGACFHGYGDQPLCDCYYGWTGKNCSTPEFGKNALAPAKTCLKLKQKQPSSPSGNYWIDPDEADPSNAFLAYCDMETDGGGWTLVWAYTFKLYESFQNGYNAVKPTPKNYNNFGAISETAPKNETDFNALDFLKWRQIGSEVFMKSNINNWIACLPNGGSFVTRVQGSMKCRMIKQIASICSVIPDVFECVPNGCYMIVRSAKHYYFYETNPKDNWPTHDPCGRNQPNHLKNVPNPHGNIYVR